MPQDHDSLPYGSKVIMKTIEVRKRWSVNSSLGEVRLHSIVFETMTAGQTQILKGIVNYRTPNVRKPGDGRVHQNLLQISKTKPDHKLKLNLEFGTLPVTQRGGKRGRLKD